MSDMSTIDPGILFCMFKGEPGTRKSTQALSFPGPQYWFSFDCKMKGINIPMREWGVDPKSITYDDYLVTATERTPLDRVKAKLQQLQVDCPYKTIVLDSVTSCADLILRQTLHMKGGSGKQIAGIAVSSVEDFNAEASGLTEIMGCLKDIHLTYRVNVILIAHVIQTELRELNGETHMSRIIVTAAKKVAAKIPAYCDEVYHFNIKSGFDVDAGGDYGLLTTHTGEDFARTTLPLEKEIIFKNERLYTKWIAPAIDKMKLDPPKTF